MQRDSATVISLRPYKGNVVEVAEEKLIVPSAGLTLDVNDNLITGTGTDAAAATIGDTLYYVYVSNSKASFSPSSIRASLTAPSLFSGIKYLAVSGNGLNWRFVGWIRTSGSGEIVDTLVDRLVVNYYNRLKLPLRIVPGYDNDDAVTTYSETSTTWVQANSGVDTRISFIANGEDNVRLAFSSVSNAEIAAANATGLNLDSTTDVLVAAVSGNITGLAVDVAVGGTYDSIVAEGYHTSDLMIRVTGGTGVWNADGARNGAVADPFETYLTAEIMG
jgi:hypothetical protein